MTAAVRQGPVELKISLLGSMKVELGDSDVTLGFRTKKERALFSYLAVESQRIHSREVLAEMFWPGRPDGYARTNLRQALTGIRHSILLQETSPPFIHISDEFVQFNTKSQFLLDCIQFDKLLKDAKDHNHKEIVFCDICASKLTEALHIYRGEFLEELSIPGSNVFEEWVMFQREHYFRLLLTSLQYLINHHQNLGDLKKAQEYAFKQVSLAPLEESAHRQLMTILVYDDRRSAALEQYEICRNVLENELGVDPDVETITLYERIKSGQSLKTLASSSMTVQTNLPTQFNRFVGREAEIAWLTDCLEGGIYRLIAIVGMAGVGKTRLAIQFGSSLLARFPDGVWFVPLSSIDSIDDIVPAILAAIGISSLEKNPLDRLQRYLKEREALLIIDNFEHLQNAADFLFDILKNAPKVIILVTSQQRMNYQAVSSLYLRGLPYPQGGESDHLLNYAAVNLFISRANHNLPGFQLDDENAPHILRICKLVDGLPLGIELAATSIRNYSCEQIAANLEQNLGILSTTMQDVPQRHRSIRAAFSQSWDLLSEAEKNAYRKLSVFQREFSMDAASSTTGASIQVISSLVDKSLIQLNSSGLYSIQPLLRQFASEKLSEYVELASTAPLEIEENTTIQTFDPITGFPGKALFRYSFGNAIARARRSQLKVTLLLVELGSAEQDGRSVEANLGEDTIKTFSQYLRGRVRESDIVSHLVRGKFGILLEGLADPRAGNVVINKIVGNMKSIEPLPQKIKVQFGFSTYPDDSTLIEELFGIANADLVNANDEG